MKTLFAVTRIPGPAWDRTKPLSGQTGWPEHAEFMNALAARKFVLLGGLLDDDFDVLLIVDAADEAEIRSVLAGDPWNETLLEIRSIRQWTVLLEAPKE